MSWQDCVAQIRTAAGEGIQLSDRDIETMLDRIVARARRRTAETGSSFADFGAAGKEIADDLRLGAQIERRNQLANLVKRQSRRDRIAAAPDPGTGIMAEMHKVNTPFFGSRYSAEGEWHTRLEEYASGLIHDLERRGLLGAARRGQLDREWARELYELSKDEGGRPGITGSREALSIAEAVDKWQTRAKNDLNKAGAWVGDYQGYITRTSHDPDRIRRAGLDAWKAFIRDRLDPRTFEYVASIDGGEDHFLDNVYHALITGVHLMHDGMQGFKDPAFSGPANLAERVSQERVLHFKNADAWLDYHDKFGNGSLLNNVLDGFRRSARSTALMNRWGTNPRAEFAADLKYFAEEYRPRDPAMAERLNRQALSGKGDLWHRFDFLDGTADMPVNRLAAKIGSTLRLDEALAKLGNILFTHLSSGMTRAAELRHHGVGFLESYGDYLASMVRGARGRGVDQRELMDALHAGMEGALRELHEASAPNDSVPGVMAKLTNTFFKAAGFTYFFNAERSGAEYVLARRLGWLLDRPFAELPEANRKMLGAFRVTAREWELLRQAPDRSSLNGRDYVTPDLAQRIPDAAVINHLFEQGKIDQRSLVPVTVRQIEAFRDDLALRLHAYLRDTADRSMITPGIREKATLLRGFAPGTVEGEIARFIAQFKMWPAALVYQGLGRELNAAPTKIAAVAGVLHMILAGTLFGYLRMSAADLAAGKNPRDPNSAKTWLAALAQGGGLGLYGDFLFGEFNRFGGGAIATIAGPVLGEGLNSAASIWNEMKEGRNPIAEAFRLLINQMPFNNMFYTRLAFDYLFNWQVQEALNPGFVRRFERRVKQQNNQTFWLAPSSAITPRPVPHVQRHF